MSDAPARPSDDHNRRFVAVLGDKLDLGDASRAAGLTFAQGCAVWAYWSHRGVLKFVDNGPGSRWIERVK